MQANCIMITFPGIHLSTMNRERACSLGSLLGSFILALTLCSELSSANLIPVNIDGNCSSECYTLDTVLQNVSSNTTLQLEPGTHTVRSYYIVTNVTDLSIIGDQSNSSNVVIECDNSLGLIFMSIKRFTIAGITVRKCGFTGFPRVTAVFDLIKESIWVFFDPLFKFSAGVMVVDIEDFVMENSIIEENKGFGMVAMNLIGNSRFSYVNFISNYPSNLSTCHLTVTFDSGGSGGGLFFIYNDYIEESKNLLAERSNFTFENGRISNNYICRRDPFTDLYNRLSRTLESSFALNTSIAGAGGVSVEIGQSQYRVKVIFDNCIFFNNSALYQNAAMNVLFYNITQESQAIIQNCSFDKNGGLFYDPAEFFPKNGLDPFGALGIVFFVPIPEMYSHSRTDLFGFQPDPSKALVQHCTFSENRALSAGGLLIFSFTTTTQFADNAIAIKHCTFRHNYGNFGSGVFITELSYSAFESRLAIVIESILIEENSPLSTVLISATEFETRSAVDLSNVEVHFIGNNTFSRNLMTAMYTRSSALRMSGIVLFSGNAGINGGGLHMERESYVIFVNKTELAFVNNSAIVFGGAMYVDFRTIRANAYDCWLYFENINTFCDISGDCAVPNNNYIIKFLRNNAQFGRAVYGSNLFDCPWASRTNISILNITSIEGYSDISHLEPNKLPFVYDPPLTDENLFTINSFPLILSTVPENNKIPVRLEVSMNIEPGQQFTIPLIAYDRLIQPVPLTIFSQINDSRASARIGNSNRRLLPGGERGFVDIPVRVNGSVGGQYSVFITTSEASLVAVFTVHVSLKSCSPGFVYNNSTMSCECEIDILDNVNCNPDGSISFESGNWIGRDIENRYLQAPCIRDFCDPFNSVVSLAEPDTQCRNNRSGMLCGDCANGFSRILGGTGCEECTTNDYLALIVLFAALGIILFVILALLNVTITDGFINGFIFYSNIFSVYTSTFLPVTEERGGPALVSTSFLNLNFGIKRCFYIGMTELDLVGLTLIFPMYLLLILISVALFGKYVTNEKMSNFYSKIHITHVFATLLYIFYSSCLETCIAVLSYFPITIEGEIIYRWGRNPNVLYGQNLHGVLVAISVLLLIFLVPLPIVLLVPRISYRISYIRKYKPVIDAFIAPFAKNRAFWVSFRLVFRVWIYVIAVFGVTTTQLVIMSFSITSMTLLQAYLKPFANRSRNIVDIVLMFNLTLFSIAAIVFFDNLEL